MTSQATSRAGSVLTLTALAVGGDLALTACQVFPMAIPVVIGALYWHNVFIYWVAGGALVFLVWLVRPGFRIEGRELTVEEAPLLHGEVARLKAALRVPRRMEVRLDGSLNASAVESRGYFGIFGTRRVLVLGIPLLAVCSRDQLLAVIAHEFGHFSRRHGRLGQWLYRARVGWIEYSSYVTLSDNALDQAAAWFARRFVPIFSRRCFAYSRQCEYEADADAASVVGPVSMASALTSIGVVAQFQDTIFAKELERLRAEDVQPPRDFFERFASAVRSCPPDVLKGLLHEALEVTADPRDTHPKLADRLGALSVQPKLEIPAGCAGEDLLGDAWPRIRAEFDERWAVEVARDWRLEHLRTTRLISPRVAPSDAEAGEWPLAERLRRAVALRRIDPRRGLAALAELHDLHPADGSVTFAFAAALLADGDASGVPLMQALAREQLVLRVEAFACLARYYARIGDDEQAARWGEWLGALRNPVNEAMAQCLRDAERGAGRPSSLPALEQSFLAEVLKGEPCVGRAYLLETESTMFVGQGSCQLVMHTLVLVLDPAVLAERNEDENRLIEQFQDLLQGLVPRGQAALVEKRFTTEEQLPEGYRNYPLALPASATQ